MSAKFKLAGLNPTAEVEHKFHGKYRTIMKPAGVSVNDSYLIDDPTVVKKLVGQMARDNYKIS
eukprot:1072010-Ditylum_brightwellii.AAC.1